jgi:hypothetical protein
MMKTYRKLTQELSNNNNKVESWKHKYKKNEQHTKLEQKQQYGGAKSEKFDNEKLWNYKAYSPNVHNYKSYWYALNP